MEHSLKTMRDLSAYYIKVLLETAVLSYCKKRKVGSLIVRDGNIISFGYNGTPPGMCNDCEDENGKTFPHVLHAEVNAIAKAAKQGFSLQGATLFNTLSPCFDCAKLIIQSGISEVYYVEAWENDIAPLTLMAGCGIKVRKYL